MLGIRGTYHAIKTANGPAQHIACSLVGLTYCAMFDGMVPSPVLIMWGLSSLMVAFSTIWMKKIVLQYCLMLDFFLSLLVLTYYMMYTPAHTGFVYYSSSDMTSAYTLRGEHTSPVKTIAHGASIVMMAAWSLYLSDLVRRQILDRKLFDRIGTHK